MESYHVPVVTVGGVIIARLCCRHHCIYKKKYNIILQKFAATPKETAIMWSCIIPVRWIVPTDAEECTLSAMHFTFLHHPLMHCEFVECMSLLQPALKGHQK